MPKDSQRRPAVGFVFFSGKIGVIGVKGTTVSIKPSPVCQDVDMLKKNLDYFVNRFTGFAIKGSEDYPKTRYSLPLSISEFAEVSNSSVFQKEFWGLFEALFSSISKIATS